MKHRTLHTFALGTLLLLGVLREGAFGQQMTDAVKTTSAGGAAMSAKTLAEARAQAPKPELTPRVDQISGATLANFAWLTGSWQGAWGPRVVEETWMVPKAGEMLGIFRVAENDKTLVIELFSLLETPDGIEFRFRHFTPSLVAWEPKTTALKLASIDSTTAVFENPAAGQPKRATFTRVDPDTYVSRSEISPEGNPGQVTEIKYHRETSAGASAIAGKTAGGSKGKH